MNIGRGRFLIGLGAFASVGPLRAGAAAPAPFVIREMTPTVADLGSQGALYRFPMNLGAAGTVWCTAAVLPRRSFAAQIVPQQTKSKTAVQDVAKTTGATVAINGARFNGAFDPDGLLIVDKRVIGQKRADLIGYLTIDADGNAAVTKTPDLKRAKYALQGDPLVIEPGGKMGMIREDYRRARRSLIVQSGDTIVAMVTTPVSLFSLAYGLMERPGLLYVNHIDAALNLSGAATTSFYAKAQNGEVFEVPAFWPNREVITFAPRGISA